MKVNFCENGSRINFLNQSDSLILLCRKKSMTGIYDASEKILKQHHRCYFLIL